MFLFFNIPVSLRTDESEMLPTGEYICIKKKGSSPSALLRNVPTYKSFYLCDKSPSLSIDFTIPENIFYPHILFVLSVLDPGGQWYATITNHWGYSYTSACYQTGASVTITDLHPGIRYRVTLHRVSGTDAVYGNYNIKLI